MYLLDTNIVSELRRSRPNAAVVSWIRSVPNEQLYLCAVSLGEIQAGVKLTRTQDPDQAKEIEAWLDRIAATLQVLPLDGAVCRACGRLMSEKSDTLLEDGLIAACAIVNGLIVVTRNVRDFATLAVQTYNPFAV